MARGPRFWALGVESGLRGEASEGILDPQNNQTYIFELVPKGRLRSSLALAVVGHPERVKADGVGPRPIVGKGG